VEIFLWIDPLVGLSTAIAARWLNVAVVGMAVILAIGLVFRKRFLRISVSAGNGH
jgi:hypothetical protein